MHQIETRYGMCNFCDTSCGLEVDEVAGTAVLDGIPVAVAAA